MSTAWKSKATAGVGDFKNPEPGPASAVCVGLIDMGTDPQGGGQYEPKRKMMIKFEIDQTMDDGRPFSATKFVNLLQNYGEKAGLRLFYESWRGKKYEDDEEIDIGAVLGAPAMLTLVESRDGKYVNIDGVSRLPKTMTAITPSGPLQAFNLDDPDWDVFADLSERMQERIMRTPEYKASMGGGTKSGQAVNAGPAEPQAMPADFDDEIPF